MTDIDADIAYLYKFGNRILAGSEWIEVRAVALRLADEMIRLRDAIADEIKMTRLYKGSAERLEAEVLQMRAVDEESLRTIENLNARAEKVEAELASARAEIAGHKFSSQDCPATAALARALPVVEAALKAVDDWFPQSMDDDDDLYLAVTAYRQVQRETCACEFGTCRGTHEPGRGCAYAPHLEECEDDCEVKIHQYRTCGVAGRWSNQTCSLPAGHERHEACGLPVEVQRVARCLFCGNGTTNEAGVCSPCIVVQRETPMSDNLRASVEGLGLCPCHAEEDAGVAREALLAVLDRVDAEINAGLRPEHQPNTGVPDVMLRVYIREEIRRVLDVP